MKRFTLLIVLMICVHALTAQTATMSIGNVDISSVPVGGDVIIPVYVNAINDGTVYTMQFVVEFNHSILTWKGTQANPLPGITNFHPNFPYGTPSGNWAFVDNGTNLVSLWDDPVNFHTFTLPPNTWYEMIFTYNGGLAPGDASAVSWAAYTEVYDQNFSQYALTLINGSVYTQSGPSSTLNLKMFLEGPYFNNQMTPFLNLFGYIPLSQPYNSVPWNYEGTESVTAIPNANVVDWVLVQLLSRHTGSVEYMFQVEAQKAAFLLKNGDIKALDGTSNLLFSNIDATGLYLRIFHRNHLALISSQPLTGSSGTFNYDFTTGPEKNIGGSIVQKQLNTGLWGVRAADGNANKQVDNNDKNEVWLPEKDLYGYYQGDYNMNSQVDNDDKVLKWKPNAGTGLPPVKDTITIPPPIITLTGIPLADFSSTPGVPSAEQSYFVSGAHLTDDIAISAPADFEISLTTGTGFGNGLTLTQTGGNVPSTEIFVRFNRPTAGTSSGDITHTSAGTAAQAFTLIGEAIASGTWTCGDPLLDQRDGQTYNTVQIGTQCWMAENLNVGTRIDGIEEQTNNSILEKYCYDNLETNCDTYGGLYQWNEMMQYTTPEGTQGICPIGWHLPTDGEWCTLTQFIDPTVDCNTSGLSGNDIGTKMKSVSGWNYGGNGTNNYEFNAFPGGQRQSSGIFYNLFEGAHFSSSTQGDQNNAWVRELYYSWSNIQRWNSDKQYGFSVRCIKDTPPTWSCGDVLIDERDSQSYNTVQIGDQCWMAENLNMGTRIDGAGDQTDNSIIEKYCYDNLETNCDTYGGLYQWNEVMQYTTQEGTPGICPSGWHVPSEAELCILTQYIDPTVNCNVVDWTGTDVGYKMKSSIGWNNGGNGNDQFGFNGLPSGLRSWNTIFDLIGGYSYYWSSKGDGNQGFYHALGYDRQDIFRMWNTVVYGFSVRCIKDTPPTWSCGDVLIDQRDSQSYNTVQIGEQCWMAENLNIGTRIDGIEEQTNNSILEKYCYDNLEANCDIYGGLYQWNEIMQYTTQEGAQGICPDGWHVPKDGELTTLTDYLGGTDYAGGKLKEAGYEHWEYPNIGATNESNFTALGAGYRYHSGPEFFQMGTSTDFWTSTQGTVGAWFRYLDYSNDDFIRFDNLKSGAYSVRCIKDTPPTWSCGDVLIDERDSQSYNTVQIGTQCWMARNLNVGTRIDSYISQSDNTFLEKYCHNNDEAYCGTYGGLYQWNEMMQYVSTEGVQGVCPTGWHLPTDGDWCTLTTFIDATVDCYINGLSGTDVGTKMKSTTGWNGGGNGTNSFGFNALPGGYRLDGGILFGAGSYTQFWSSSLSSEYGGWTRDIDNIEPGILRGDYEIGRGHSVRCIKDTLPTWSCGDVLLDERDDQSYNTVQIGTQCWMAENLNIGTMIDGSSNQTQQTPEVIEKYCYDNNAANCSTYGGLYQWNEMMEYSTTPGAQGICPAGWHLPTDAEWSVLTTFLGGEGITGGKMKATGTIEAGTGLWYAPNEGATNESGFTALPGGIRGYDGYFYDMGFYAYFWSSAEADTDSAWLKLLFYHITDVLTINYDKHHGFSSRCVQD